MQGAGAGCGVATGASKPLGGCPILLEAIYVYMHMYKHLAIIWDLGNVSYIIYVYAYRI
jgi:hypothetical protein